MDAGDHEGTAGLGSETKFQKVLDMTSEPGTHTHTHTLRMH